MEWVPAARLDLLKVADPLERVAVPTIVDPSLNVTVPMGAEEPEPVTWAVKTTACPYNEGFSEEDTEVVVGFLLTTWVIAVDVLAAKVASPAQAALIEWEPAASVVVVKLAAPLFVVLVPIVRPPNFSA